MTDKIEERCEKRKKIIQEELKEIKESWELDEDTLNDIGDCMMNIFVQAEEIGRQDRTEEVEKMIDECDSALELKRKLREKKDG